MTTKDGTGSVPAHGVGLTPFDQMVCVGRIVRPQGNRGQVVVAAETDFPETRFAPGAVVFMGSAGGVATPVTVVDVRMHKGRPVLTLEGVTTMNAAEALRGVELRVPADQLQALGENEFYVHDLVGCRVETTAGATVGTVKDVERNTAVPVLVITGARSEVLVPFTGAICRSVDMAARVVVIDPPAGLLEANE